MVDWLDFEYHEGWVMSIIPIQHAWLVWRGRIIDLTLEPDDDRQYLSSIVYTADDIRKNLLRTGCWGPIDERELAKIGPFAEHLKKVGIL
jgi:hypothetical protein